MIDNILEAINLASLDNLVAVEVSVEDLQVLRHKILELREVNKQLVLDTHILDAKLGLAVLETQVKLDVYM